MAGLVVAGLTTWQYEGTTAKKKNEHRISYLKGGGLLMEAPGGPPHSRRDGEPHGAGLFRRTKDRLGRLDVVRRLGEEDVVDVRLRVAVVEREQARLDLDHDPVAR